MTNQFPGDFNTKATALVTGDRILIADSEDSNEVKGCAPEMIFPGFFFFGSANNNQVGASTTQYLRFGAGAPVATELDVRIECPVALTLKNFRVRTRTAQPAGGTLVFTVRIAGSDTTIVISIAAGAAAGVYTDTTHTEAITAGQGLSISVANNAGGSSSAQIAAWSMEATQ